MGHGLRTLFLGSLLLLGGTKLLAEDRLTPVGALVKLMEGNRRFMQELATRPRQGVQHRQQLSNAQAPFAVIVGCSDSRVSPEIIFDQGLGDLFVVRVAGNVVGPVEIASIDYSAIYLHSSIILVLGHEQCGAIRAVLDGTTKDIEPVVELMDPALTSASERTAFHQSEQTGGSMNLIEESVKENVRFVVEKLRATPAIQRLIREKKIDVVGGYYHFTGEVELL